MNEGERRTIPSKEVVIPSKEAVRKLEMKPYPEHLGGDRLLMVLDILDHEKKKDRQSIEEIDEARYDTYEKLVDEKTRLTALRDIYNKLDADMVGAKLKGGFLENISAENVTLSLEKLPVKDIHLMPFFAGKILKLEVPGELVNGEQVLEYYKQPEHRAALIEETTESEKSFGGGRTPREEDNIIVRLDENGKYVIYDGNGRFLRKITNLYISANPISEEMISAWVLKTDGAPPKNFWVPTSELAKYLQYGVEKPQLKKSVKKILDDIYQQSPKCTNLELDRAAEMSEYKEGDARIFNFVKELRKSWRVK